MAQPYPIEARLNRKGKPSLLLWQGLLYGVDRPLRVLVFAGIVVLSASLVFSQLGFIGVGTPGNYVTYGVSLLALIAFGAVALGLWQGTLLGILSGSLLFWHATFQPLDYYEVSYVTPESSIILFTITGFFLSLLLAGALRKNPVTWRRIVRVALVCLFASLMFSVTFFLNVVVQVALHMSETAISLGEQVDTETVRMYAVMMSGQMGDIGLQVPFDALLMFVACVAGDAAIRKLLARQGSFSLHAKFRGWLLVVVTMTFAVTGATSFVVITEQAKEDAAADMRSQMGYVAALLNARDAQENLLEGYSVQENGTVVVLQGDQVVLSDNPRFQVGSAAGDYIGLPELARACDSQSPQDWGMLQATLDEGLLTADDFAQAAEFPEYITTELVFMGFERHDDYTIMSIIPATKVFAGRNATMAWTSASALVLLLVVFALVSLLLNRIVVRRIDETNDVLGAITGGDLDARVNVRDSTEFASLSEGINTMVDALKDSIAEAASRMDAELAAAKEIQESTLPQVFPPFPDIPKFDVYASMNAAREVGGDFYDFFLIGDDAGPNGGKLGFVIADVSGKGVPAALFMMKAKTQIHDYLASGMEVGEAVENANRQLCDGNEAGMFVTAWVGVLDYATGHVEYVNAGHNPPLLWQGADGWRWLAEKSGLPLGLFDGFGYEAFALDCQVGDEFLLYTDGVTEAMSEDGELYGEERLEALARGSYTLHPRALVNAVRRSVALHAASAEQSDDITVLALEVGVPPEVTATLVVRADVGELPRVNEFIHTELDRRLCPVRAQSQLDIAVEELFVNVARYAYPDAAPENPGTARVSYTYSADPPSVRIAIADEGIPYNPLAKPDAATADEFDSVADIPIGGLGILMAKNSVDDMAYERIDGSNVVTITKKW